STAMSGRCTAIAGAGGRGLACGSPLHWPGAIRRWPGCRACGWTTSGCMPAQSVTVSAADATWTTRPAHCHRTPYQAPSYATKRSRPTFARVPQERQQTLFGRQRPQMQPFDHEAIGGPLTRRAVDTPVSHGLDPRAGLAVEIGLVGKLGGRPEIPADVL